MTGWGGKRIGAGRPKGTVKAVHNRREHRQLVAFDDEWELINRFAKLVKYGDKIACERALLNLEQIE